MKGSENTTTAYYVVKQAGLLNRQQETCFKKVINELLPIYKKDLPLIILCKYCDYGAKISQNKSTLYVRSTPPSHYNSGFNMMKTFIEILVMVLFCNSASLQLGYFKISTIG